MEKIYIGLVNTPGLFASVIRQVIKQDYIHVVISMDENLTECYSVGRRDPFVPIIAGFEKEEKEKIVRAFPTAQYMIYSIECTSEQKKNIRRQLKYCYDNRYQYHYCVLGLPFILVNREFYQESHYTCSSFVARLLDENGIHMFDKHFSLVTPKDFYMYENKEVIYEGSLKTICEEQSYNVLRTPA